MFLARGLRAFRVLSMGSASTLVAAVALVAAAPAHADEVYPRPSDNTITLAGHGYGHGHGMSQWGAYGAATQGRTWQQILGFYYPGTTLSNLGSSAIRVRLDAVGSGTLNVPNAAGLLLGSGTGTPAALAQTNGAVQPITRYRVWTRSDGSLQVDALSSPAAGSPATWVPYKSSASPAVFSNPGRGNLVDVLLANGTQRTYRGSMAANWLTASSITPVNTLPMDDYLRAVVPAEMPSSWPADALAAQAVAARSYAAQNRATAPAGRVNDTCDTTSCQVYSGLQTETSSSDKAVANTAGQTLTWLGQPAFAQFGSSNGGWSADGGQPYLVAKADPYDGVVPNSANTWTNSIPVASIESHWPSIGSYQRLRILSRDGNGEWGGRVLQASIEGSAGSVTVTGTTIRSALGLRSEWFIPTNPRSAPAYPRDFNGDHLADVLAVVASTGDLRLYAGNGASGWKPTSVIGNGFTVFAKVFSAGTWDGDALSDVMAQRADGTLWLYPGTAAGPVGPPRQVGSSWGIYNLVFPTGDFSGDGFSDLLARRPDGGLVLYPGNGSGGFLYNARAIGAGWGIFTSVFSPGDFTGDGKPDVIARTSDGLLYLYPGNGSGGWLPRRLIGRGWNMFSTIVSSGDFNGDGRSDLLGRAWDGTLWMYPGNGSGGFLPRKAVGAGWNIFSTVLP